MATDLNPRFEEQNLFLATSRYAKVQTAFGVPMLNALLNWRENCTVSLTPVINRKDFRDCSQVNLIAQKVRARYYQFEFGFTNPDPQRIANFVALKEGTASAMTGTPASAVATLTRTGTVSGGAFIIEFDIFGRAVTTDPIAWNATNPQILAAILKRSRPLSAGRIFETGDVAVGGNWTDGVTLTFQGKFANAAMPLPTINNTSVTGGGTVGAVMTTAGEQRVCDITRSAGASKRLFSFAVGDLEGDIATNKLIDAAVNSVEIAESENGDTTMTVRGYCSFITESQNSFTVPACVSGDPVDNKRVRLLVGEVYEQRDLVSLNFNASDNIQPDGMFVADDYDVTRAPRRGGRNNPPTQTIAIGVYGAIDSPDTRLAVLAANETIDGNEVETVIEFGLLKNQFRIIAPEAKIQRAGNAPTYAGALSEQVTSVNAVPMAITGDPLVYEYYGSQTEQFLLTS